MAVVFSFGGDEGDRTPDLLNAISYYNLYPLYLVLFILFNLYILCYAYNDYTVFYMLYPTNALIIMHCWQCFFIPTNPTDVYI